MSNNYLEVGKKIRLYRKAKNYTQEELGEILHIDQSYLGRIERGEINITLETLIKISEALDIKAYLLLKNEKSDWESSKTDALNNIDMLLLSLSTSELHIIHRMLKEAISLKNA